MQNLSKTSIQENKTHKIKQKTKQNMLKLSYIPANIGTTDECQSPFNNRLSMANKNTLFLILRSKKNAGDLLCSQTSSPVLKMNENKKWKIQLEGRLSHSMSDLFHQFAIISWLFKGIKIFSEQKMSWCFVVILLLRGCHDISQCQR